MGKTNLTSTTRDKILFDVTCLGVSASDEAKALGCTPQSVTQTVAVFNAVKSCNWVAVQAMYQDSKKGINLLEWALSRTGAVPPPGFVDEIAERQQTLRRRYPDKPAEEEEDTPALPDPTPNDALVWVKVLEGLAGLLKGQAALIEAIQKQQDDFRDALTALASDLKENANVNCDLVCQRLKEANDQLAGIKINTRKKGL